MGPVGQRRTPRTTRSYRQVQGSKKIKKRALFSLTVSVEDFRKENIQMGKPLLEFFHKRNDKQPTARHGDGERF